MQKTATASSERSSHDSVRMRLWIRATWTVCSGVGVPPDASTCAPSSFSRLRFGGMPSPPAKKAAVAARPPPSARNRRSVEPIAEAAHAFPVPEPEDPAGDHGHGVDRCDDLGDLPAADRLLHEWAGRRTELGGRRLVDHREADERTLP